MHRLQLGRVYLIETFPAGWQISGVAIPSALTRRALAKGASEGKKTKFGIEINPVGNVLIGFFYFLICFYAKGGDNMAYRLDPEVEEARIEFFHEMGRQAAAAHDAYADKFARVCAALNGRPVADQLEILEREMGEVSVPRGIDDIPY